MRADGRLDEGLEHLYAALEVYQARSTPWHPKTEQAALCLAAVLQIGHSPHPSKLAEQYYALFYIDHSGYHCLI